MLKEEGIMFDKSVTTKFYLNHFHDHLEELEERNDEDCQTLYNIVRVNQPFV